MIVAVPLVGPLLTLVRLGDMRTAALRARAMGFGPLYIGVPLTLLAVAPPRRRRPTARATSCSTLMFAWFGDTGGYFAGRFLGKHKLYEAVSPKKTVEGAVGGLAGSVFGAVLAHFWFLPSLPLAHGVVLALVAGALGQAGDLGESRPQALDRREGLGRDRPRPRRHPRSRRRAALTSAVTFLYSIWFLPRLR